MNLKEIYDRYKDQVFNLCLNYLQNYEDAEEATQDVFVAVSRSLDNFRQESTLSTWIYRISINKCTDRLRAKKRVKRFAFFTSLFNGGAEENSLLFPDFNHPGVALENKEAAKHIFGLLNSLPENQQTALILSKIEKLPQQEVALIMNLSPKAVESLVQRAKTNLQKKLEQTKDKKTFNV